MCSTTQGHSTEKRMASWQGSSIRITKSHRGHNESLLSQFNLYNSQSQGFYQEGKL